MFEKYSDKELSDIQQVLETSYSVLHKSFEADQSTIQSFEAILNSDFGVSLRLLRKQNSELTEEFRLKAVAEVEMMLEQIETEIERRRL
jgi:hypothetical protein